VGARQHQAPLHETGARCPPLVSLLPSDLTRHDILAQVASGPLINTCALKSGRYLRLLLTTNYGMQIVAVVTLGAGARLKKRARQDLLSRLTAELEPLANKGPGDGD
jgi:hypothetical protein